MDRITQDQFASVAQRTEQGFPKPLVAGSSPAGGTFAVCSQPAPLVRCGTCFAVEPIDRQPASRRLFYGHESSFSICRGTALRLPARATARAWPLQFEKILTKQ